MCEMLLTLFNLVWNNEYLPTYWRECLTVSLFKKGDREGSVNYRGTALLSVIGKLYSKVFNNHLLKYLELNNKLHQGQGGFRIGRSCIPSLSQVQSLLFSLSMGGMPIGDFFIGSWCDLNLLTPDPQSRAFTTRPHRHHACTHTHTHTQRISVLLCRLVVNSFMNGLIIFGVEAVYAS